MDYEKFYRDHIPKTSLPSDFGGDCDSVAELHEKHCKEFSRLREFFVAEEKQAALELDQSDKISLQRELVNESERGIKTITLGD